MVKLPRIPISLCEVAIILTSDVVFLRPIARSTIARFTVSKSTRKPREKGSATKENAEELKRIRTSACS